MSPVVIETLAEPRPSAPPVALSIVPDSASASPPGYSASVAASTATVQSDVPLVVPAVADPVSEPLPVKYAKATAATATAATTPSAAIHLRLLNKWDMCVISLRGCLRGPAPCAVVAWVVLRRSASDLPGGAAGCCG